MHIFEWCLGWFKKPGIVVVDIDTPGLQYRLSENRLQHKLKENKLQYRIQTNRLHYRVPKD
jgi:hypothetical protein